MEQQGEIILYQPDESVRMEVRIEDETVWLTQAQIVELFQSSKANISEHVTIFLISYGGIPAPIAPYAAKVEEEVTIG